MKVVRLTGPAYLFGHYVGLPHNDEIVDWIAAHAPDTVSRSTLSLPKYKKQRSTLGRSDFTGTWRFTNGDTALLFKLTFGGCQAVKSP